MKKGNTPPTAKPPVQGLDAVAEGLTTLFPRPMFVALAADSATGIHKDDACQQSERYFLLSFVLLLHFVILIFVQLLHFRSLFHSITCVVAVNEA